MVTSYFSSLSKVYKPPATCGKRPPPPPPPVPPTTVCFNTPGNGTWIVPAGVTLIHCEAWAAGGGGSGFSGALGQGGGGGGGYAKKTLAVSPGASVSYFIGTGGLPSSPGTQSWISTTTSCRAAGGNQGVNQAGGTGGAGTHGDSLRTGGKGGTTTTTTGGGGGGSPTTSANGNDGSVPAGGTGEATGGAGGAPAANGTIGGAPGAGGGGKGSGVFNSSGSGANGRVCFTY
jgi:hypothetical protein